MRLRGSNILGLAMDDRGIRCAEIVTQGSRRVVRKLARFTYPADGTPAAPAACGAALKAFLDKHDIDTRRAVVGVPARWLIAQERELPPTDRTAAIDLLRLHGERMATGGGQEMIVDVAGDVVPNVATRSLLVGMLKPQLDRLIALGEAAGIDVIAISSSSLATHDAIGAASRGEGLVLLGDGGSEVVGGGTTSAARLLKHAPGVSAAAPASVAQLGSELRRTVTLNGLLSAASGDSLNLWNGAGLPDGMLRELSEKSGVALRSTDAGAKSFGVDISPIALNGEAERSSPDIFLPAIALASGRPLPIDFLDTRLAPPKQRRFGKRAVWGVAIAALVVVGLLLLYQDIRSTEQQADVLSELALKRKPQMDAAKAETARLEYGRSYFQNRPPVLQGLREVTLGFNFNESIWATSFTLRENGKGVIQGKATDQRLVLDLRDRLAKNPKLTGVVVQNLQQLATRSGTVNRGSGPTAGEQSFTINFAFQGTE